MPDPGGAAAMNDVPLHERTAGDLARLVCDGAVSCREVVDAHLARIDALEPRLGAVVIPLHTQHYLMLSRNLLYTALTRAKKTVVMIGTTQAIGMAMRNLEATRRFTGLAKELKQ